MRFFYSIVVLFSSLSLHAEVDTKSFAEKHVYPFFEKATDQNSQFILASGAIAVFLVEPSDVELRADWRHHHYMSKSTAHAGDLLGSGIGGAVTLGSQYFFDSDSDNWVSHFRALVYSTVFSTAMKYSFRRPRPGKSDDHLSFPSGHTTTAFTTATSLAYAYGWKAAAIAYPLAAFVGLSRLSDDAHWGSDVVAGAFIGFWAARASFYSTNEIEEKQRQSEFSPIFSPGQLGVAWTYVY